MVITLFQEVLQPFGYNPPHPTPVSHCLASCVSILWNWQGKTVSHVAQESTF